MAHFLRLGAAVLLGLTLCMLSVSSHAATGWKYVAGSTTCGTAASVGPVYVAGHNGSSGGYTYYFTHTTSDETTGVIGGTYYSVNDSNGAQGAPVAWSHQSVSCTLGDPVAECSALADGLNYVKAPLVHYGSVGLTACFGGYVLAGTGSASGGGQTELYGPFKCSGASPTTCSVVPKPSSITADCAAGSYPGTVNGVQVCVPPSTSVEAPKTTTATPPTSGASAPSIPGAPSGTTTEEKRTVCDGPTCTTTTTYKDGAGASTGSKTEAVAKSSYCAENPKAPGCDSLEASTFGGSCAGGFTFKGDAIQGALAKEVYKQNCIINDTSDESALYTTKKSIAEGDLTSTLPGNQTVSVGSGDFDASDAIGGAACITNKTVVVWGKTIVLPFSDVCPAMGYLKTILLAVSWLSAAGIVIGRKT